MKIFIAIICHLATLIHKITFSISQEEYWKYIFIFDIRSSRNKYKRDTSNFGMIGAYERHIVIFIFLCVNVLICGFGRWSMQVWNPVPSNRIRVSKPSKQDKDWCKGHILAIINEIDLCNEKYLMVSLISVFISYFSIFKIL